MNSETHGEGRRAGAEEGKPTSIDVMQPGFEEFLADQTVDITVKAEELDPADPGQLSGASLTVSLPQEDAAVSVKVGCHNLGLVAGAPLLRFLAESLAIINREPSAKKACGATLADCQPIDGRLSIFRLQVAGELAPTLTIVGGQHVFGIIRGEALRRFLEAATLRAAFGKQVAATDLATAVSVIRACFNAPQDLGEVRVV